MPNFKQDRSKFTMKGWSPFTKYTSRTGKAIEKSPRYKKLKVQTPQSLPTKEHVPQTVKDKGHSRHIHMKGDYIPQSKRTFGDEEWMGMRTPQSVKPKKEYTPQSQRSAFPKTDDDKKKNKEKNTQTSKPGMYQEWQKLDRKKILSAAEKARKKRIEAIFDKESQYSERN